MMDRFSEESPLSYARRRDSEPFFTESLPCENCGAPTDGRVTAYWNKDLQVGACCMIPQQDVCPAFQTILATCRTVDEVAAAMHAHLASCRDCDASEFGYGIREAA
jgi:hypothetical protein